MKLDRRMLLPRTNMKGLLPEFSISIGISNLNNILTTFSRYTS